MNDMMKTSPSVMMTLLMNTARPSSSAIVAGASGPLLLTTPPPPFFGSSSTFGTDTSSAASAANNVFVSQFGYGGTAGTTIKTPTTSDHILLGICFIVGVLGIVGNTVMVISILAVRSFRQSSNIFFFHHGLLEIAKSALIIPFALSITGKRASYCELLGAMQCVLVTTTSLNLAAITINESFIISHAIPGSNNIDDAALRASSSGAGARSRAKQKAAGQSMRRESSRGGGQLSNNNNNNNNNGKIKIIPALESGAFNKPSLKRNITCVVFGVLLIWMASLVLNMGVSLITGSGQYNEKIGLCYFVYGHQKSYVVNVMWIVVTSLGVGATVGCLRKLKMDLRRAQEYLMRTFPGTIKSTSSYNTTTIQRQASASGQLRPAKSLPHLRQAQTSSLAAGQSSSRANDEQEVGSQKGSNNNNNNSRKSLPRSTTIDERHQQRLSAMMSKHAFQQTRLLNCQFNVIVLQTISFIVFWYPLFGLIIADKDFEVDTEIYKALTVLAWLNAPLTPVFFTYFNYECYSTQVAVKLSVVGNAAAEVVREQALIAEKIGTQSDEEGGESGNKGGGGASGASGGGIGGSTGKDRHQPPPQQQTATININRKPQMYNTPKRVAAPHALSNNNMTSLSAQFQQHQQVKSPTGRQQQMAYNDETAAAAAAGGQQRHSRSFYYEPQLSTFKPSSAAVPVYMGRSLQENVNAIQDDVDDDVYWFERRDLSSNSLHQLTQRPLFDSVGQMTRTETFPKLQFEDQQLDQQPMSARSARSLKEIRDFRMAAGPYAGGNGNGRAIYHRPYQQPQQQPPPPPAYPFEQPMTPGNRPHSYENITRYVFDDGKRSRTAYMMDDMMDDDGQEVRVRPGDRQPITCWTGVIASTQRAQSRSREDFSGSQSKLCSWREIARQHPAGTTPVLEQQPRSRTSGTSRRSNNRKTPHRSPHSGSTSDDEDDEVVMPPKSAQPKAQPKAILRSSLQSRAAQQQQQQLQQQQHQQNKFMPRYSGSITVTSSTDVDVTPSSIQPQATTPSSSNRQWYVAQQPHQQQQQQMVELVPGFKNPVYIEAFRRANLRSQQAVTLGTSEEDGIPLTDMGPYHLQHHQQQQQHHRSSAQRPNEIPQLRFVHNQGPWNNSVEDDNNNNNINQSAAVTIIEQGSLSPGSRATTVRMALPREHSREKLLSNDDDGGGKIMKTATVGSNERVQHVVQHLEPVASGEEMVSVGGSATDVAVHRAAGDTSGGVQYTRIETHVTSPSGSVDRLQIWLGKLDGSNNSATNQPPQQQQQQAPPQPPKSGSTEEGRSRRLTHSLIHEFQHTQQLHQQARAEAAAIKASSPSSTSAAQPTSVGSPKSDRHGTAATSSSEATAAQQPQQGQSQEQPSGASTLKSEKSSGSDQREVWI